MSLAGKVRSQFETAAQLSPKNVDVHTDLAEFYVEAPGIVGGGTDKAENQAELLSSASCGTTCRRSPTPGFRCWQFRPTPPSR